MAISPEQYPFLQPLSSHWQQIRDEYLHIANHVSEWPETYLHNGLWDIFGLFFNGQKLAGQAMCPVTSALINEIPGLYLAGFSIMRPGCLITPHTGFTDTVWRTHLGLICPEGAWIVVGEERFGWEEGKLLVFDDCIPHYAANQTDADRVVLIVDFRK
jgi:aspartyl/asparaginyl beta-hydroxylase (cupin superfamily)